METLSVLEIQELAEGSDLEVKKAAGRDGKGELPASFFESYSAMANTDGGVVLLGIEEKPKDYFTVTGIIDTGRVLKSLWDELNDKDKVSRNLLTNRMVEILTVQGKSVVRIRVPRARRPQRPVYVGTNPLRGTYRRNYEGDYHCDDETVRRMLAEQVEDERDGRIIENFDLNDLELSTLQAYRNRFSTTKPSHPWLALDDREFLRSIGGWRRDRQSNAEGLTLAGLLMFGKLPSILEAVPYYVVDYQERSDPSSEARWDDRVTTDGTWSGNLFDFYRIVFLRLSRDLKVPFKLKGVNRVDETPMHEALREALVNTLIHGDYTGRVAIKVIRAPGIFVFRNPGMLRLPLEDIVLGGNSDCRNRRLQKMFQLVGLGEQAGSGIPKIYENWKQQHWRVPLLWDETEPEQTLLGMQTISLLPEETLAELDGRFGPEFRALTGTQRLALATVAIEGKVTRSRLKQMTDEHPSDLSKELGVLVRAGFLESAGQTRGTFYVFPNDRNAGRGDAFQAALRFGETGDRESVEESVTGNPGDPADSERSNSEHLEGDSEHLGSNSEHLGSGSEHLEALEPLASEVRNQGKTPRGVVEKTILKLCRGRFLSLKDLANLLDRSPDTLRVHYISGMVKFGQLDLRYPDSPNHPDQAYRTAEAEQ